MRYALVILALFFCLPGVANACKTVRVDEMREFPVHSQTFKKDGRTAVVEYKIVAHVWACEDGHASNWKKPGDTRRCELAVDRVEAIRTVVATTPETGTIKMAESKKAQEGVSDTHGKNCNKVLNERGDLERLVDNYINPTSKWDQWIQNDLPDTEKVLRLIQVM